MTVVHTYFYIVVYAQRGCRTLKQHYYFPFLHQTHRNTCQSLSSIQHNVCHYLLHNMTSMSVTIYFMINAQTFDVLTPHTRNKDPYKKTRQNRLVWASNCPSTATGCDLSISIQCTVHIMRVSAWGLQTSVIGQHDSQLTYMITNQLLCECHFYSLRVQTCWSRPGLFITLTC